MGSKSLIASRVLPKHPLTVDHNVAKVTHDALLVDIDLLPQPFIMDTRSHSPSPHLDVELPQDNTPPIQDKISAYYSLVFPGWTFYIQTLTVTIGRRCAPNANVPTSSSLEQAQVDVDLGNLKSVSRFHAKIEYDQEEDRFVLVVIGRNGAWVDGVWCSAGTRATLGERYA